MEEGGRGGGDAGKVGYVVCEVGTDLGDVEERRGRKGVEDARDEGGSAAEGLAHRRASAEEDVVAVIADDESTSGGLVQVVLMVAVLVEAVLADHGGCATASATGSGRR